MVTKGPMPHIWLMLMAVAWNSPIRRTNPTCPSGSFAPSAMAVPASRSAVGCGDCGAGVTTESRLVRGGS
ncbi:hypothetical protein GCM10010357_19790 [Streptomyces luteireticuli]|uniref:Secreted protein n=1 Tax=Streptomyces luteireticuli TaxID=173858 RepID=A0ABN0YKJ7_9ACTN